MADHLNQIQSAAGQIGNGSQQLSAGIDQYTAAVGQAKTGSEKVTTGSQKLYVGARQLSTGVASLTKGTDLLAAGASKLQNGAADLQDGVTQLAKGSGELSGKLDEGAAKLKGSLKNTDDKAQMMANPVELKQTKVHPVPNYGTGFSPYFISLALYVGALLLFIVLDVREVVVAPKRATSWLFGKFMVYSTLGILQAIIVASLLQVGLGLEVANKPMFYLMSIMTSLTFVVLIQGLISILGEAGRFVAIVILMLQLTSSAGTFPLEMTPNFFVAINPYLPMTYTVAGLKAVISNGDMSLIEANLGNCYSSLPVPFLSRPCSPFDAIRALSEKT